MKLSFKLALLGAAIGVAGMASAQQRPLSPAAAAAHAANAALAQCHAAVHRDIATFRTLHAKAVREHAVSPAVLKNLTAHEQAIVAKEARLANHETLAQCQTEERALKALDAELAKDIALGECHALIRKDVATFRADLAKANKEHAVAPAVLKRLTAREALILNHEKALGSHETLAACQAEHKNLQANDALLKRDIAFGECHMAIRKDVAMFRADLAKATKEHAVSPVVLKRLTAHENSILAREKAMGSHETIAACQAEDKALKAVDAELRKDIALGECHIKINKDIALFNAGVKASLAKHTKSPAVIANLRKHEATLIAHEKGVMAHETVAACQAHEKQFHAMAAMVNESVALGDCHLSIAALHTKIAADIKKGIASNQLKPAAVVELKKHEADILKHEAALHGHETIAQCNNARNAMVALEKAAAPHLTAKK